MTRSDAIVFRILRRFWLQRRRKVDSEFRRSLPFGDYVVDRWERANEFGFGSGTSVYDSCLVLGDVTVGRDVWVGPFTVLDGSGGLSVGDRTTISAGVQVYSHDSLARTRKGAPVRRAPTSIGADCYLGPNVVVGMGITIGDGCTVGANSLVLADVPPGRKVWGNPAIDAGEA